MLLNESSDSGFPLSLEVPSCVMEPLFGGAHGSDSRGTPKHILDECTLRSDKTEAADLPFAWLREVDRTHIHAIFVKDRVIRGLLQRTLQAFTAFFFNPIGHLF